MKRIVTLSFAILFGIQLFAQDNFDNTYGLDKRWSFKAGAGYFIIPKETDRGYSLWWEGAYALESRLELHAKLNYSTASVRMSAEKRERLWPSNEGSSDAFFHRNERNAWDYSLLELGVSYPIVINQRHCISPGAGLSVAYARVWHPSHSGTVAIDRLGTGYNDYYGVIGEEFYRGYVTLYLSLQVDYTYHFNNGLFVGARAHTFYDFTLPFITVSPLVGVRF